MVKESIPPLMSETSELATADEEKAEVLNNFFASVFTSNLSPHPSRVDGWHEGDQEGKTPPAVSEDQVHRITESQNSRGWKGPLWVI